LCHAKAVRGSPGPLVKNKEENMKKAILGCAVTAALVNTSNVMAGGLWLNEFGDFAGGRASAGASAGTDDAATIAHNPASSSRIEGDQLFVSGGVYLPDIQFDVDYSSQREGFDNGGDAGLTAPAASLAYVHNYDDSKWSTGVYLGGFAGAGLEYNDNWAGRYNATDVDLLLMMLGVTVAYEINDKLTVGAALQGWYSSLEQKLAVPRLRPGLEDGRAKIDGDDSGFGFTLGALYELDDRTRFGAFYQSELEPKYDGNLKLKPADLEVSTDTELNMAQYLRLSMHHDLDENWAVNLTIGWDDWSVLDNVFVSTERGGAGIPTKWRDTYHYAWGAEYRLNDRWDFTGGVAYDTNPVDAGDRTPELPVDRQIRYAVGAQYHLSDDMTVGGYVNYADLGKARIEAEKYGGKYQDNGVLQLAVNFNWAF